MTDKFLVIGSNSISGSSFIRHLLEQGADVVGASRSRELPDCFLPYKWLKNPSGSFRFLQADLNTQLDLLLREADAFEPGYVVNFAAQSMVAQSWEHPAHWYQTNVVANVLLHDELRKRKWLKKYVHISTPEVYGTCSGTIREDAPFNPSTPYAASRAACDLHLSTFLKQYHFPVCFTRAANVYGAGQQLYRIIPRTIFYILLGRRIQLHGGGASVRAFIHLRDVASATHKVATQGRPGDVFHLSTDRFVSIRELVEMICARLGVAFGEAVEVVGDRPGKDAAYLLDSTKAHTELDWKPVVGLEEGIEENIEWIKRDFETLKKQDYDYVHKP